MIPCGTSKAGTLAGTSQAAELPVGDSEGICERPRSAAEDNGHLFGLSRDDLPKSMSDSSISSYHSALCSEGTETFGDCLEFLEEEEEAPAAQPPLEDQGYPVGAEGPPGRVGASAERWAPGGSTASPGGAPSGAGAAGSRPQEERTQQVQLSVTAKNSAAVGHGGRMGPGRGERPPAASDSSDQPPPFSAEAPALMFCAAHKAKKGGRAAGASKAACAPRGALSDSDEADNEVQKLTARSFRSLSGPHGGYLDMYSSHTSSSLSNSLSEDGGTAKRWPTGGEPRGAALALHTRPARPFLGVGQALDKELVGSLPGKEQFECVDVELESNDAKKGHCKKRTVPKRQIQLKRKERKEAGFFPWGDCSAHQPLPPPRKEPLTKGRAISDEFRINYKQFMRTASLDDTCDKTRMASCLVKNVLAKKMQYEQRIKMEQKALQGSSTSSGPSSVGTDLAGDCLEGKSSSLSKSDCSYSAEDVQGHVGSQRPVPVATRPTKGVVLNEETRENVCKLKTTFNELNERIKYQEVMQCQALLAEQARSRRREDYRRARAMFEPPQDDGKAPDAPPKFEKPQKPWPSLRQRAIRPSKPEAIPFKPKALSIPVAAARSLFTSRTQEVKLVPQSQQEEKAPLEGGSVGRPMAGAPREAPPVPRRPPVTRPLERTPQPGNKGKGQIPQPRDVRKLVKNTYSLCFKPAGAAASPAPGTGTGGGGVGSPTGSPAAASPLFIHCTSVCRKEPVPMMSRARQKSPQQAEDGAVLAVPGCEAREARTTGPTKPPERQRSAARDSPMSITKIQSTRRVASGQEGPAGRGAEPAVRHERSELTLPPVARAAPHMESHLHVRVSPPSTQAPSPAQGGPCRDGPSAPAAPASVASSAVLLTEKTVLFPPPASATEEATGHHHAAASARAPNPPSQQPSSSEGFLRPPGARGVPELAPPAGVNPRLQATQPAAASGPKPPVNEHLLSSTGPREAERERPDAVKPPGGWVAAAGSSVSPGGVGASAAFQAREASEEAAVPQGPSAAPAPLAGRLLDHRENWEHLTKQTGANEQYFTATPVENTNYLTIPVKAPKSSPAPKLPSVPSPASAVFGTPLVPNQASTSFGHPSASSPASTSFGTPLVPSTASTSFRTPLVPNRASTSFGHPSASSLASTSFGSPLVPNTASTSFGTPLVPTRASTSFGYPSASGLASTSFGSPLAPNPSSISFGYPPASKPTSASFGSPMVPNPSSTVFGAPLVPNLPSTSFGAPLAANPGPASLWHPSVSNPASSSPGSPSVPKAARSPLVGGEAPQSHPSPELPLPPASEGQAAAEQLGAQPQLRLEDAAHFLRRTDGTSPSSKSTPSPTRPFAPHQHRKMLLDPDSGKCYYMEPPRQPQLKTLYDPETGQYLEVLIPPVPLASHAGLYQAPLVMTPGVYGPPYVPYAGFSGLAAPAAVSPAHADPQGQAPAAENASFGAAFSPAPKGEGPPGAAGPDCSYLDSLYYIPTGMRASPGPGPGPGQPAASSSPGAPEKAPLLRM